MVVSESDDGYLKKLYIKHKQKIYDYVNVSGNDNYGEYEHNEIKNLLDWDCQQSFRYFSIPVSLPEHPYLIFEFKKPIPRFVSYSFETHFDGTMSFPLVWDVKGRNDAKDEWILLDERNTTILSYFQRKSNFTMKKSNYKFIKFQQYSNFYNNTTFQNTMALRRIDFYPIDCTPCFGALKFQQHCFYILLFLNLE